MRIRTAIEEGRERLEKSMSPREADRCIHLLLQELRGSSRSDLIIEQEASLTEEEQGWLEKALKRLEFGEPLQYVLGHEEFYGLHLKCDRRALIPRPETEEMVAKAIRAQGTPPGRILDLGTGNGCIALALKQAFPDAEVHAVDRSSEALELARENMRSTGLAIHLYKDDLDLSSLSGSLTFDLVVSNPPYVAEEEREELDAKVRDHEPEEALFVPSGDPLEAYRAVIRTFLKRGEVGASFWMEINPLHVEELLAFMEEYELTDSHIEADLSGKRRFAFARR